MKGNPMIRQRTDQQVLTSAAQMDAATEAGLSAVQLVMLAEARAVWHRTGLLRRVQLTPELIGAIEHPAAAVWDEIFVRAVRRQLGKLSYPTPSVTP